MNSAKGTKYKWHKNGDPINSALYMTFENNGYDL